MSSSALFLILVSLFLETIQGEWRPLEGSSIPAPLTTRHHASPRILDAEHCNLYKVVMHQDNYFQYIQYKAHIPDMKEFTLCTWHKFYNHSMDHPLFSYAIRDQPREIVSWVANTERSSFYQLAVGGHTIYRLNYPIRLFKWYHACQSWNGRTGEWQLWINSERAGRGFYNLLVGKKIKGGGLAMTGQIQRQYGGGFSDSPKEGGLYGEITLLHLYKAALTAGKAYNNHKHHHAHKFHHEGTDEQDLQPQIPQMTPLPEGVTEYPFLRGMQLVPRLPVQELNVIRQQQQLQQMQQMQQLQQMIQQQQQQQQQGAQLQVLDPSLLTSPFAPQSVRLFKRDHSNSTSGSTAKADVQTKPAEDIEPHTDGTKKKRTVDFGVFPGVDLSSLYTGDTGFILGGGSIQDLTFNGQNDDISEEGPTRKWDEPAEWEVRSIMSLCSGCGEDPFRKANVLSWRETSKKLFAGALYVPATQQCHHF